MLRPRREAIEPQMLPQAARGFVLEERPEPAYRHLLRTGELARRVQAAREELAECTVCPRDCRVDRLHAVPAVPEMVGLEPLRVPGRAARRAVPAHIPKGASCFTGRRARVSSAFPHFGEEDCLRGWRGSGTIFFAFCNLRCVFCQNWDVSQAGEGIEVGAEDLAQAMLDLAALGCHNVNFVTPEHVVPQILEAVLLAAEAGLDLPLVYNTSAYDSLRSLELMDGVVDVYMPDMKLWDRALAKRWLKAEDYPDVARRVIAEMHRQVGPLRFDRHGLAVRGVLVRHLVMPGCADDSREILDWLAREVSPDTYVNVMDQYRPEGSVLESKYPEIDRPSASAEVAEVIEYAHSAGLWRLDERWR